MDARNFICFTGFFFFLKKEVTCDFDVLELSCIFSSVELLSSLLTSTFLDLDKAGGEEGGSKELKTWDNGVLGDCDSISSK